MGLLDNLKCMYSWYCVSVGQQHSLSFTLLLVMPCNKHWYQTVSHSHIPKSFMISFLPKDILTTALETNALFGKIDNNLIKILPPM